jgi:hypothetical protein
MTQAATKLAEPEALPTPEAAADLVQHWHKRAAEIGADLQKAEAELERLETAAAQAALEGKDLPDTAEAASRVGALKRARLMVMQKLEDAEQEREAALRAVAQVAAAKLAHELAAQAEGLDDCLFELGHRVQTFNRTAKQWLQQARASGQRHRRGFEELRPSELAGAVLHLSPEVFDALGVQRPSHAQRQPLAAVAAKKYAAGPRLVEGGDQ